MVDRPRIKIMTERLSESFIDEALMRKIGITAFLSDEVGLHDITMSPWGPRETMTSPIEISEALLATVEITKLEDDSVEVLSNIQIPVAEGSTVLYNAHVDGPRNGQVSIIEVNTQGQDVYRHKESSEELALRITRLAFKSMGRQNSKIAERNWWPKKYKKPK